jgi:C_GCAxxG_C_C family probable redox protein
VLLAVCEATDLACDCIPRIAAGLGGGLGTQGEACGALTGGVLVMGLAYGSDEVAEREEKDALYARTAAFVRRFGELNGALRCRDLVGLDLSTPAGLEEYRARNLSEQLCRGIVRRATEAILALLSEWEAAPAG